MTEPPAPERIAVICPPEARVDLRGHRSQHRCGDYRIFFDQKAEHTISVAAVRHRREAYR